MLKHLRSLLLLTVLASCLNKKQVEISNNLNPIYDKAYAYSDSGVLDSAFFYFNQAKDVFIQQGDSLGVGKCLLNMAVISTAKGDHFGGQELSLTAISSFNEQQSNQHIYIQSNYNNLGITSYNLGNYSRAIEFYTKAKAYTTDSTAMLIVENNMANVYRRSGDFPKALSLYRQILSLNKDEVEFARTLSNYAYTKWLQNRQYDPTAEFYRSLKIRQKMHDLPGQLASYAFLTDYFIQKQPTKAAGYAENMYQLAKQINNPNDKLEALERLIKLSPEQQSKTYFEIHQKLTDSLQTARNAAKNQFALIRYESEKSKADNLRLQKENSEKTYQVNKQKIITLFILLVVIVAALTAFYLQKKRKERLELAVQNKIKEGRLKISKKVHDVVANGLYQVMTEIENQNGISKSDILDRLDGMYQKSRDISYEVKEQPLGNYPLKVALLLRSFESARTKIIIKGNSEELWSNANPQIQYELLHILQELMVNMDKHSLATKVSLSFKQQQQGIYIMYRDNGIGMTKHTPFNNGLTNTGNRIKSIHGEITFDTKPSKGLSIQLSIPVS